MAKNQDGQRWADDLVRRAGLAMKKARGNKSAKWLSDETAALGYRVSPTVIAKLDSGHRGSVLSVAELLVLAAALDVPPALLLFPGYPYGVVEFLPGRACDAKLTADWFSGDGRIPAAPGPAGEPPRGILPNAGTELVRLVRELVQTGQLLRALEERSLTADAVGDRLLDEHLRQLREKWADLIEQIGKASPAFEIEEKPR
jgi:hypothetical protein